MADRAPAGRVRMTPVDEPGDDAVPAGPRGPRWAVVGVVLTPAAVAAVPNDGRGPIPTAVSATGSGVAVGWDQPLPATIAWHG